jgi:hypothetical protein
MSATWGAGFWKGPASGCLAAPRLSLQRRNDAPSRGRVLVISPLSKGNSGAATPRRLRASSTPMRPAMPHRKHACTQLSEMPSNKPAKEDDDDRVSQPARTSPPKVWTEPTGRARRGNCGSASNSASVRRQASGSRGSCTRDDLDPGRLTVSGALWGLVAWVGRPSVGPGLGFVSRVEPRCRGARQPPSDDPGHQGGAACQRTNFAEPQAVAPRSRRSDTEACRRSPDVGW